jgi:hypothetical protein
LKTVCLWQILLQNSAYRRRGTADAFFEAIHCRPLDCAGDLTLDFTDACNGYAAHTGAIGGGRAISLASLRSQLLGDIQLGNVGQIAVPKGKIPFKRPSIFVVGVRAPVSFHEVLYSILGVYRCMRSRQTF